MKFERKHGLYGSRTYSSWKSMIQRCHNPRAGGYDRYGGRGIVVCDRWKEFMYFLEDMGERPEGKTLDRFPNNNGNYEPGNCRWATTNEQNTNTRQNRWVTANGETHTVADWARITGLKITTISMRLRRHGWSESDVINNPLNKRIIKRQRDELGRFIHVWAKAELCRS